MTGTHAALRLLKAKGKLSSADIEVLASKVAAKLKGGGTLRRTRSSAKGKENNPDASACPHYGKVHKTLTLLPAHLPVPTKSKLSRGIAILIAQPAVAYPDTQAQATVSPDVRHVDKMHGQKVRLR